MAVSSAPQAEPSSPAKLFIRNRSAVSSTREPWMPGMAAPPARLAPSAEETNQDRLRSPISARGDQKKDQMEGRVATTTTLAIWSTDIPYFRNRYGISRTVTEVEKA